MTSGYSGTPLSKKLGIVPGAHLLLLRAPELPELPTPSAHRRLGTGPYDVALVFCAHRTAMEKDFNRVANRLTTAGALWVCWPKRASGITTDLTDSAVREYGLASGLVDVKVAAIDATWSGLKFVRRLADR